jgi:hypothetical protein
MSQKRHPVGALGHNMPESAIMWGEHPVSQMENLQIDLQASHATFVRRKPILRRCYRKRRVDRPQPTDYNMSR